MITIKKHKLFLAALFLTLAVFAGLTGNVKAAPGAVDSITVSPNDYRALCNAGTPVDFAVKPSNASFDLTSGKLSYNINIEWKRCTAQETRAYAVYSTGPEICPYSGIYGVNGWTTDCVKYVGNPAYDGPSGLKCWGGQNEQCVTQDFSGARRYENQPSFGVNSISIPMSTSNALWALAPDNGTWTVKQQMCQYYKTGSNFGQNNDNRCVEVSISVSWSAGPTPFDIRLKGQTSLLPDTENPSQSRFTNVGGTTSRAVNGVVMTRKYSIRRIAQPEQVLPSPPAVTVNIPTGTTGVNLTPNPDTRATTGLNAGDQVCVTVTASPGSGKANSSNNITEKGPDKSADFCARVVNKPYLSVYSGDVYAGGNFANTVTTCINPAKIDGYIGSSGWGSGTQLAATALGAISGFNSASWRTSGTAARPNGLSFANTPTIGTFGASHCLANYFADSAAATAVGSLDLSTAATGDYRIAGNTTINGATIPNGRRIRLFVEGTATINGNIQFASSPRSSRADIPGLQVIARNITISNAVQVVDGIYIAQPQLGQQATQGIINTCSQGTNDDALYGPCGNQLVINGAFIANKVRFLRSLGSLRNANTDQPFGIRAGCSGATPGGPKPTCAGEVFNFTPELYLTVPGSGNNGYAGPDDYIVQLPPVL